MNSFRKKFIMTIVSMLGITGTGLFTFSDVTMAAGTVDVSKLLSRINSTLAKSEQYISPSVRNSAKAAKTDEQAEDTVKGKKKAEDNGKTEAEDEDEGDGKVEGEDEDEETEETEEKKGQAAVKKKASPDAQKKVGETPAKKGSTPLLSQQANQNVGAAATADNYGADNGTGFTMAEFYGEDKSQEVDLAANVRLLAEVVNTMLVPDPSAPPAARRSKHAQLVLKPGIQTLEMLKSAARLDVLKNIVPPKTLAAINEILKPVVDAAGNALPVSIADLNFKAMSIARILSPVYQEMDKELKAQQKSKSETVDAEEALRYKALNELAGNMAEVFKKLTNEDYPVIMDIFSPYANVAQRAGRLASLLQKRGFSAEEIKNLTEGDRPSAFYQSYMQYLEIMNRLKTAEAQGKAAVQAQPQAGTFDSNQMRFQDPLRADRIHALAVIAGVLDEGPSDAYEGFVDSKYNELTTALLDGLKNVESSTYDKASSADRLRMIFDDEYYAGRIPAHRLIPNDETIKGFVKTIGKDHTAFTSFKQLLKTLDDSKATGYDQMLFVNYRALDEARMNAMSRCDQLIQKYEKSSVKDAFSTAIKPGSVIAGRLFAKSTAFKEMFEKSAADGTIVKEDNLKAIGIDKADTEEYYGNFVKTFMSKLSAELQEMRNITNGVRAFGDNAEEYYQRIKGNDARILSFLRVVDVVYPILNFLFSTPKEIAADRSIADKLELDNESRTFVDNLRSYDDATPVATLMGMDLAYNMNMVRYFNTSLGGDKKVKNVYGGDTDSKNKKIFPEGDLYSTIVGGSKDTIVGLAINAATKGALLSNVTSGDEFGDAGVLPTFMHGLFTIRDTFGYKFGLILKQLKDVPGLTVIWNNTSSNHMDVTERDVAGDLADKKEVAFSGIAAGGTDPEKRFYHKDTYKKLASTSGADEAIDFFLGKDNGVTEDYNQLKINAADDSTTIKMSLLSGAPMSTQGRTPDLYYLHNIMRSLQSKLNNFEDRLTMSRVRGLSKDTPFKAYNKDRKKSSDLTLKYAGAFMIAGSDNYVPTAADYAPKKDEVTDAKSKSARLTDEFGRLSGDEQLKWFEEEARKKGYVLSKPSLVTFNSRPSTYYGGYRSGSSFGDARTPIYV